MKKFTIEVTEKELTIIKLGLIERCRTLEERGDGRKYDRCFELYEKLLHLK